MLDSGKKRPLNDSKALTIVGQGASVNGEIRSKGTVRIEGYLQGRVNCEDTIVVQETGKVKAELIGAQVIISGEVEGNVTAHERLEITTNGKLVGDITAPKVSIAEGVLFEGKCTMKPAGQVKPPAQPPGGAPARPEGQAPPPGVPRPDSPPPPDRRQPPSA